MFAQNPVRKSALTQISEYFFAPVLTLESLYLVHLVGLTVLLALDLALNI